MNEWIDGLIQFDELIQIFRILLAVLLGACIGFEREKFGRPAGLRTHMIVCVASSLAMLISIFAFDSGDPSRLAAQVISGIGFIGAGTIIRGDKDITGITTAATIWICAIIGLSCGSGYYFGAIATTILALIILSCFTRVETRLSKNRKYKTNLMVILKSSDDIVDKLKDFLNSNNISLSTLEYKNVTIDNEKLLRINMAFEKHSQIGEINNFIARLDKEFAPIQCKVSNESYKKSMETRD